MRNLHFIILFLSFVSCNKPSNFQIVSIMNEWVGKEIRFPHGVKFSAASKDTLWNPLDRKEGYAIVTYVDSIGCISCKLQLNKWKGLISEFEAAVGNPISVLLYLHPKNRQEIEVILARNDFTYPVCIDEKDTFNKLNHFPLDMSYRTFLVDKDNKVVAIGNPVHNLKVKELYLNIISGKKRIKKDEVIQTTANLSNVNIDMGEFDWNRKQEKEIKISNTGDDPLVIIDVTTSCGCTTVEYAKEAIMPKKSGMLKITYQAEHPEHFNKTVSIHCNIPTSPMQIKVTGNAE